MISVRLWRWPLYTLLSLSPVKVTFSVAVVMTSSPSTILNVTFVKFLFVFSKSSATMPTGYLPTFVPFAVHAAVSVALTLVVTSYSSLFAVMDL